MARPSQAQPLIELSANLEGMINFPPSAANSPTTDAFIQHEQRETPTGVKNVLNCESKEAVLLHVALCHSIIIDKRTGKMNSASPDELALVEGA